MENWIIGTGFSRGIGKEMQKHFKEKNFKILHLGRTPSTHDDLFFPLDLSVPIHQSAKQELALLLSDKNIAGCFFAAGVMPLLCAKSNQADVFWKSQEQAMRVHYYSCAELIDVILPFLFKSNYENPFVAHLSSLAAVDPFDGLELYGATKNAVLKYFTWLSNQYPAKELLCLSIHPGTVHTDMTESIVKQAHQDSKIVEIFKELKEKSALLRPEESADKISKFLLEDNHLHKMSHGKLLDIVTGKIFI